MDIGQFQADGVLRPINETWKLDNIQLEFIVIIKMTHSFRQEEDAMLGNKDGDRLCVQVLRLEAETVT